MAKIELVTCVKTAPERCFDLARDIDLHQRSLTHTGERSIAGRTSGLIEMGEEVTWRAKHFGILHLHTTRITAFERPTQFGDSMSQGRFRLFVHDHFFEGTSSGTCMRDVLDFRSPLGPLGALVDVLVLKRYLRCLLTTRNALIQLVAEDA